MMKHTSSSRNDYKLSSDSSTSPSPFPTCFPSPPPSIASFASSISANSSFSSTSSNSLKSNDLTLPSGSNLDLRFTTNLSSRLENALDHDNYQQRPTTLQPPVPPVRHKRLQKLLQENNAPKIENHDALKLSPVPAPRTSCNLATAVHQRSGDDRQSHQQWRSASPPLLKAPVVSVGQYWTYQRQKQLHKQTNLMPTSLPERLFKPPKVIIKVYAQTLCQDVEYITLPVDNQTKSSQVVRMLLKKFRLRHKDPNLFYISLERWIKKDGIPIKSVMILGNDACPALLQSCCSNPPHNDIRFTLLMKNGALVKIYCSDVVSDSLYKSLSLSTQTTVEETIELLMNCLNLHHNLGSDTSSQSRDSDTASLTSKSSGTSTADQFELIEVCEATNYRRVLRNDEYLLEVHQSLVNDLDLIVSNNYKMDNSSKHSSFSEEFDITTSGHKAKAEFLIKLVRKEEHQLKSFDRLLKFNGQQTAYNSSDVTFKVSNFRPDHNSCFTKPHGYHQSHHHHFPQHYNHQQNNRLAHHNYRHYSQEQLIDDLDKLSLILDDDKEQKDGGDVCVNTNHYEQASVNSGFTHAWKNDRDGNNNSVDILSHKVILNVDSPTTSEIGGLTTTTIKSIEDDNLDRICPVAPMKNSRNVSGNGIELYENISLSEKLNDNDSKAVQRNSFNVIHNSNVKPNDNDSTSVAAATPDNSKMLSTKNLIAINQEDSDGMPDLLSKGQDVIDKQVSIVYQPSFYCLSMDELKMKQLIRAAPNTRLYENLNDEQS